MRNALWFLFVAFAVLLVPGTVAPQASSAVAKQEINAIPFAVQHGFLVVIEGQIGEISGVKFILDTGATCSMVDTRIAKRLALALQPGKVLTYDRFAAVGWAKLPQLQVGTVQFHDTPVMVGDLRNFSEFADDVDGVLGLDILATATSIVIDYPRHVVLLRELHGDGGPAKSETLAFTVQVNVQGQPLRLIIDTGRTGMLLYTDRIQKHTPHLQLALTAAGAREGRLAVQGSVLPAVRLGPDEVPLSAMLLPRAPASFPQDIDGYVGTDLLKAQRIEIDLASHTIRWQ
jgi:Aspartyl protease